MNVKEELYNILMAENVIVSINENQIYLFDMIPELRYEVGFEHKHPHHHLDVWNHTLLALSLSERDFDIRLALLLHDLGKPFSYQEYDGIRHFKGHPKISSEMSKIILKRLGFSDYYNEEVCYLIAKHDEPITEDDIIKYPRLTLKRYEIQRCDALAHHPEKLEKRQKYLEEVKEKCIKLSRN